jgi:hypothetical protein
MTYMFDIRSFVVLLSGECDLARAAAKAISWNGFGCARDFVRPLQVLVRVWTACAMACRVSVGFEQGGLGAVWWQRQLRGT